MSKSWTIVDKRTAQGALARGRKPSRPATLCAPFNEKLPPIHPGEALADVLHEAGVSATSAAIAMGLPPSTLTRIIRGQRNVTAPIALRIARYFGTFPDIRLGIQTAYDLEIAKDREGTRIERDVRPLMRSLAGDTRLAKLPPAG
jgi:addiction module HigA family antidote